MLHHAHLGKRVEAKVRTVTSLLRRSSEPSRVITSNGSQFRGCFFQPLEETRPLYGPQPCADARVICRQRAPSLVNTTSDSNTAVGTNALFTNTSGTQNAALGDSALYNNTTGNQSTALGSGALLNSTTAVVNTGVGFQALLNTTGNGNLGLGGFAGQNLTTGFNNIMIANDGLAADDKTTRIGSIQTRAFIAGIRGITTGTANATGVMIDSNGQLGTVNSSRRLKEDIRDMGDSSSNLLRLRPVTYRYKESYTDGSNPQDYGLIAEEVAEVYPDLVVKNKDGDVETVQYHKLTPMLLNEVQKQDRRAQLQDQTIQSLQTQITALQKTIEALLSNRTPVSAQAGQ
jgi:hypothetical protein